MNLKTECWITDKPYTLATERIKLYILLKAAGLKVDTTSFENTIRNGEGRYKGHIGHVPRTGLFPAWQKSRDRMIFETEEETMKFASGISIKYTLSKEELIECLVKMIKNEPIQGELGNNTESRREG